METQQVTREEYEEITKKLGLRAIGGSHVLHLMCPDNKYSSKYKLYKEITEGRNENILSPEAEAGIDLEPWVVKEFLKRNKGYTVNKESSKVMLVSTKLPFVVAAIDRVLIDKVTNEKVLLECKTTDSKNDYKWEDDEIPDNYYWQCIHYMLISGIKKCYIACFVGFSKYKQVLLSAENKQIADDIALLDKKINEFWSNHILLGVPPVVDGGSETRTTLDQQASNREFISELPLNVKEQLKKLPLLKSQIDLLKNEVAFINNSVISAVKGFGKAKVDSFNISYSKINTESFNLAKFKEEHPTVYDSYKTKSSYTKLLITELKK